MFNSTNGNGVEIVITLKHGRLKLTAAQSERIGRAIAAMGDAEIRIAGRCIIVEDCAPLTLIEPIRPKRKKRRK